MVPESLGGLVRTRCDAVGWKIGGNTSNEAARAGCMNSGGMGGGAKLDVKMPSPPSAYCGKGACIGGGLLLKSKVSTSESDVLLCVDKERLLMPDRLVLPRMLCRIGEVPRDAVGVAKGSAGGR